MQTSLAKTFRETATAAYKAFPHELKNLVVLLVPSSDTPVYVSPAIAGQLTKNIIAVREAVKNLAEGMRVRRAAGTSGRNYDLAGTIINLIALDKNSGGVFSKKYTQEMELIFSLDHEIGHHILKNGYAPGQLAESAADAYAMLRHIQRFGKKTDHAGGYGAEKAACMVLFSDAVHYTTDSIQRAIELSEEMDISKLSLRETVALADKIAVECRLDNKTLNKIRNAFLPVGKFYQKHPFVSNSFFAPRALSVMKKYRHDPDIFRAGKQFLSHPVVKAFMTKSAKTEPAWQEALDFVEKSQVVSHKSIHQKSPRKPG